MMSHKRNARNTEPTGCLVEFEEAEHPETKRKNVDVFLRFAPKKKVWLGGFREEQVPGTDITFYRSSVSGIELLPPGSGLESVKEEIRKQERRFIEEEIKCSKGTGRQSTPRMLTKRLKELDAENMQKTEPDTKKMKLHIVRNKHKINDEKGIER